MIAVDTNLLVYAHRKESRVHEAAFAIVRTLAEGSQVWAIPWPCCYEFLSVVTNPRIWKDAATSPERAWQQLEAWTTSPSNRLLGESAEDEHASRSSHSTQDTVRCNNGTLLGR